MRIKMEKVKCLNGYLNVYKEKGMTSHDVVFKARKILKTKKIGHTGTLDPDLICKTRRRDVFCR